MFLLLSRITILLLFASCVTDKGRYGRVELYGVGDDRSSFVFTVSDELTSQNKESPQDKKNPKITEVEAVLLTQLLKQKKICLDEDDKPLFEITSRQEKIFDATFAHLIEENYKARPLAPKMYFGKCIKAPSK
ncbi:MAG: hypothetical protein KGP29_07605 [Proteobacteria bacterium]|nr:hypothetical protein [Pseudomonadota bacterium]